LHRRQVGTALPLENNHGRITEPDQHKVHDEPPGPAVSVNERVYPFELVVKSRKFLRKPAIDLTAPDLLRGCADVL
jgi:hypothetical protein